MTILTALAIVLAGAIGSSTSAQEAATRHLPRVYVFTQVAKPGQPAAPDQAGRRASASDLREELRKKPKILETVDALDKADVTVEVVGREAPSATRCILSVRVRAVGRSDSKPMEGESRTCRDSASLVAEAVQRWVNETFDAPAPGDARTWRFSSPPSS